MMHMSVEAHRNSVNLRVRAGNSDIILRCLGVWSRLPVTIYLIMRYWYKQRSISSIEYFVNGRDSGGNTKVSKYAQKGGPNREREAL